MVTSRDNQLYTRCVEIKQAGATNERIDSRQLLGKSGKLTIEHDREDYSLRITKSGKLILTK